MRSNWLNHLENIVYPVLSAAASDTLKEKMPVYKGRNEHQYLEALGRIICGIGPWLNLELDNSEESKLREKYVTLTVEALSNLVNPKSSDYVNFGVGYQALVDAAYLTQGLLRAPRLWNSLQSEVKVLLINEVKKTRKIRPPKNNWLLFTSMIEAFLLEYTNEFNKSRLYTGVRSFITKFYFGDGLYGDGRNLSIDYYNSFVIQPMLIDVLGIMLKNNLKNSKKFYNKAILRYKRYVELQERMISPEGAYPVFGRTLICKFGAFHALAQSVLINQIPRNIAPSQIRCALNSVLNRHMNSIDNFDSKGFLTVGFNGKQNDMAENYVSSGSAYHCCTIFLPLGLNEKEDFWASEDQKWTSCKAFNGQEFLADHALHEEPSVVAKKIMIINYKLESFYFNFKKYLKLND